MNKLDSKKSAAIKQLKEKPKGYFTKQIADQEHEISLQTVKRDDWISMVSADDTLYTICNAPIFEHTLSSFFILTLHLFPNIIMF